MRRPDNRKQINKLFLLGAGSSYSLTCHGHSHLRKQAPLDKEFTQRLLRMADRHAWVKKAQQVIRKDWKDHHPFEELGLEEAIIKQIGHFDFLSSIHPRRGTGGRYITDYVYDLTHLITVLLSKVEESDARKVKDFCDLAFPSSLSFEKQRNRIITFNYDTVIDSHLANRFKLTELYFDNIRTEATKDSRRRTARIDFPLLVKLHGSANWRVTKDEFIEIISGNNTEVEESQTNTYNTRGCYFLEKIWCSNTVPTPPDNDAPLIIPPLPQKPITSVAIFRYLWTYAYEYLHECKELVICGYSLPDADTLAVSMFSNFSNLNLRKITIIDPNVAVIQKWKDLLSRRQIRDKAVWTYYDDFTQYIEMEAERLKRNRRRKKRKKTAGGRTS